MTRYLTHRQAAPACRAVAAPAVSAHSIRRVWLLIAALAAVWAIAMPARAARPPLKASEPSLKLDSQIDWSRFRQLAVQDGNRYKTMESFARDAFSNMYGKEHLPGLSPIASLFDWTFRGPAYADAPVVRIKERGLQLHFSSHMSDEARARILATGYMTPREMFDRTVLQRMGELEPRFDTRTAMRRVRTAEVLCKHMPRFIRIVPGPSEDKAAPWYTPDDLKANAAISFIDRANPDMRQLEQIAQQFGTPVMEFRDTQTATLIVGVWKQLGDAWRAGDAATVQRCIDRLAEVLPTLAAPGVYPSAAQRAGETRYYQFGKFAWGYWLYLLGGVAGVFAMVTRWRIPWALTTLFLLAGLGLHTYGVILRWQILGRIPNANMFEAITFAAWGAIALGLVLGLLYRSPLLMLASNLTGYVSLVVAHFALDSGISAIMGILDDIMLRIHTTVITISYVLVFLAGVLGTIYLFGYYLLRHPARSLEMGGLTALAGGALVAATSLGSGLYGLNEASGSLILTAAARFAFAILASVATAVLVTMVVGMRRPPAQVIGGLLAIAVVFGTLAAIPHGFARPTGWVLLIAGAAWSALTIGGMLIGTLMRSSGDGAAPAFGPALQVATAGAAAVTAGAAPNAAEPVARVATAGAAAASRPILAGALPGDERDNLPRWLHDCDWMHLIILNLVFVLLFIGTILGAVWADYSWGRPWGWDPKEVFAMTTWFIYVILIHVRFVVKRRGLWTAWLSVTGTAMMAFNWWAVNHYIVGIHSYA
jgi:ABC-type transport system involved in cytochrome c biogenesis permease subunit